MLKKEIHKGLRCDSVGKPESLTGRTVCVIAHPGKMALFPFVRWFEKRYAGRYKRARLIFGLDMLLLLLLLGLGTAAALFYFFRPPDISERLLFDASVAPRQIMTGAPSTLVIRYTNASEHELRDARLTLGFPEDFLFQEMEFDGTTLQETQTLPLGTLPIGAEGSVRVRGVMFGEVGGEQTFRSILTFRYGDRNFAGQKSASYSFSPSSSTLALRLTLPEKLITGQTIEGTLAYANTGELPLPEVSIEPVWPKGFTWTGSSANRRDGVFHLRSLNAGETGELQFSGRVQPEATDVLQFVFHPAFTFGNKRYRQTTLEQFAPVTPPPLFVSHSVRQNSLTPGGVLEIEVHYENRGETDIENVQLGFGSDSPFLAQKTLLTDFRTHPELKRIEPGARGSLTLATRLRNSVGQSELTQYENIRVPTFATATYRFEQHEKIVSQGSVVESPLTTPLRLDAFARYATPSGDQIGRGPLPPVVGEETKYWVMWNVHGTTNRIENLTLESVLGPGVRFTGKQTVSSGNPLVFDESSRSVVWKTASLESTFSPTAKVIGIAFEVALTPTPDQLGTIPVLLAQSSVRGIDAVTGAFVSASAPAVSTSLAGDLLASGKATVEAP